MGHRDDVTANLVDMKDIEQLTGTSPDKLKLRVNGHICTAAAIIGTGSIPALAIQPAKTGMHAEGPDPSAIAVSRTCLNVISAVAFCLTPAFANV